MIRLGENLTRSGLSAELVTSDVSKWKTSDRFEAILLDAPCSGTGTLRRHPDIAWLKDEEDIARLTLTQDRLLAHAIHLEPHADRRTVEAALRDELAEMAQWLGAERVSLPRRSARA